MKKWTESQQVFLVKILAQQAKERALAEERQARLTEDASRQSTLFDHPGFSLKTAPESKPKGEMLYWQTFAIEATDQETESLPRLMLKPPTEETDGSCMPTLLAADCRTIAYSTSRGKKILRLSGKLRQLLPTLCATDYKSPYSAEGYRKQAAKRSKPLRDTAKHTVGIRLSPDFCEWWMGWPIGASASNH
jgi:hypothetical protein